MKEDKLCSVKGRGTVACLRSTRVEGQGQEDLGEEGFEIKLDFFVVG